MLKHLILRKIENMIDIKGVLLQWFIIFYSRKKISINFSKENTKFCLSSHYNGDESYLYVNKTEIYKFKVKDIVSWYNFCLGCVSKDFTKDEHCEISLCSTVYNFSVDHNSIKLFTNI